MKNKGFTLVELLAVIAILAILVIVALPNVIGMFNDAKKKALIIDTKTMAKESEELYIANIVTGKTVKEVSDDGEVSLNRSSGKNYRYKFTLDQSGKVVSIIVNDGNYCIETNKNYVDLSLDDIFDCDSNVNNDHFYAKILKDNTAKSDASIDLSKSSFLSSIYITTKDSDVSNYNYNGDIQYCYGNDYSFDGTNHNLESYECGGFSSDYKYFCEENPYCQTMYEVVDGSDMNNVSVYKHVATPTDIIENGKGLFYTTREDEKYYYFRGNVSNNNLLFVGYNWKITRINPDNSVRIMLYDSLGELALNNQYSDSRYVGYMYGNDSTTYESTHNNINNSDLKNALDSFSASMIDTVGNYLTDYGFCYDRSTWKQTGFDAFSTDNEDESITEKAKTIVGFLKNKSVEFTDSGLGYGTNDTFYSLFYRALYGRPTFSCKNKNDLFTTSSNAKGNQALSYPVGIITADEAIYAGAEFGRLNPHYYLYYNTPWLIFTPLGSYNDPINDGEFRDTLVVGDTGLSIGYVNDKYAVRPVVDIKAEVLYDGGDGSISNPYRIKLEQ